MYYLLNIQGISKYLKFKSYDQFQDIISLSMNIMKHNVTLGKAKNAN